MELEAQGKHPLRSCLMVWRDQGLPATDVLLRVNVPFVRQRRAAYFEINNLPGEFTG
jgi:hypothetical protein